MRKILVVDDEPQIRSILSLLLKSRGFQVADAACGQQAVHVASQFSPSVTVLDMKMPGMDGLQTLQALLALNRQIDCIMMTAYGTIPAAVEAIRMGAFDYITKPF